MENNTKKLVKKGRPAKSEEAKLGWLPDATFTERQRNLIKKLVAPTLNDDEMNLFIYRCLSLKLDPLKGEVSVHKRKDKQTGEMKMVMVVQRDGYLTIAHRSGQFNGMKTDLVRDDKGTVLGATCKVWNKSAEYPVEVTVYMQEYNTNQQLWSYKPLTMIQKVAESQALRKAFNISGVYSEEEVESWNGIGKTKELPAGVNDDKEPTAAQLAVLKTLKVEEVPATQREARELIAKVETVK